MNTRQVGTKMYVTLLINMRSDLEHRFRHDIPAGIHLLESP